MKRVLGFTIVEIAVIIVITSALVTLTFAAYSKVQSQSRDTNRMNDIALIKRALQKYHDTNGEYPHPAGCTPYSPNECWKNEWLTMLVAQAYLDKAPLPYLRTDYASGLVNFAPDNTTYYGWYTATSVSYSIYVPLESGDCKTGMNVDPALWNNLPVCKF